MNENLDTIRNEIRKRGFMSEAQIKVMYSEISYIDSILKDIECEDINSVSYTNRYLKNIANKKLYYCGRKQ